MTKKRAEASEQNRYFAGRVDFRKLNVTQIATVTKLLADLDELDQLGLIDFHESTYPVPSLRESRAASTNLQSAILTYLKGIGEPMPSRDVARAIEHSVARVRSALTRMSIVGIVHSIPSNGGRHGHRVLWAPGEAP